MKKIITIFFALFMIESSDAQAPDSWTEKKGFGLNILISSHISPRNDAVSFTIGNEAYIGTGFSGSGYKKDFWQFSPATNTWTQKADFLGTARSWAAGFSTGNKGYIGTGDDGSHRRNFYEYDPLTNIWTQKADFGGLGRRYATGFGIGNKGYMGTGYTGIYNNDFWEYDPITNAWTQKANLGGAARNSAVGFSIGTKGYLGTGTNSSNQYLKDFWEYDPSANAWTQKADLTGVGREDAVGFSMNGNGYIGTGVGSGLTKLKDFWEYNPNSNTWTQKANFGGTARYGATGFSAGNKGYIGTGNYRGDFWEYDPVLNNWSVIVNYDSTSIAYAAGFGVGSKGYVGTGYRMDNSFHNEFWEFNPSSNTWTKKANFGGVYRKSAVAFAIGNKGYMGTGDTSNLVASKKRDFWEYDFSMNAWTQKADFSGAARSNAVGFSIGNRGYIGTGDTGSFAATLKNDFWEYDPIANIWAQKSNFGGTPRNAAVGFSIGNKGYIGTGSDASGNKNDFWEYDPVTNGWTPKANFGGVARTGAAGFSISGKGYIGTGYGPGSYKKDFWEFDPGSNMWTQRADFRGDYRSSASSFSINNKGYIGNGRDPFTYFNDFWEYTPLCSAPVSTVYSSGTTAFCSGDSVFLYANNGYNYQWKKNGVDITGATSCFYYAKTTGSYTCYLTNSCGAVTSGAIAVIVNALPSATITPAGPTTFCSGGNVVLNAPVAANRAYQWKKGANFISGATLSSYTATTGGNYRVIVTNTLTGCSKTTGSATVVTINPLPTATITPQGPTTFCAGGSVVLAANTGAGLTYKWKKGSNFISGATLSNYTATLGGTYKVEVTNSNGCSKLSTGVIVTVPCREGEILSENRFDVKVFPNPSSGDFTFEISNGTDKIISVNIYDMVGKLIFSESIHNSAFIIHNSQLTPGVYSAEIMDGVNRKVKKLIKTN